MVVGVQMARLAPKSMQPCRLRRSHPHKRVLVGIVDLESGKGRIRNGRIDRSCVMSVSDGLVLDTVESIVLRYHHSIVAHNSRRRCAEAQDPRDELVGLNALICIIARAAPA